MGYSSPNSSFLISHHKITVDEEEIFNIMYPLSFILWLTDALEERVQKVSHTRCILTDTRMYISSTGYRPQRDYPTEQITN